MFLSKWSHEITTHHAQITVKTLINENFEFANETTGKDTIYEKIFCKHYKSRIRKISYLSYANIRRPFIVNEGLQMFGITD